MEKKVADKTTLIAKIDTDLADNTVGAVTPAIVRGVLTDMVNSDLNTTEETTQTVSGQIDYTLIPTVAGVELVTDSTNDGAYRVRSDGGWVQLASLIATSNASIPVDGDAVTPSFMNLDDDSYSTGIRITDAATGTVQNNTGRDIGVMTGTFSFHPDVTGGSTRRLVLISERSTDNITWTGNLNSIRKVEIGADSESFKTNISLVDTWGSGHFLRFRAYDETGNDLSFEPSAETILGQPFTGPSITWTLHEN